MAYYGHAPAGHMYADATESPFPQQTQQPQNHQPPFPVQAQRQQQQQQQFPSHLEQSRGTHPHLQGPNNPAQPQNQSHGVQAYSPQPFDQQPQHQQHHPRPPHFQNQYTGFNPEPTSMPPPSTAMGSMSMNAGATMPSMQAGMPTRGPGAYQAHMRNSSQQFSPSSPGFLQSPTAFNTSTPPAGAAGQSFFQNATQSPTKTSAPSSVPTSMPQLASNSPPQSSNANPMHKPMSTPPQKPILQPPLAPEVAQTETKRVSTILEINRLLLQEIIELQAAGRTGPVGQQGRNAASMENSSTEGKDSTGADSSNAAGEKQVSREYMECMRRLQSNLAYLTVIVDRYHRPIEKIPERPAIMEPIPANIPGNSISEEAMQSIRDSYKTLKELFPDLPRAAPQPQMAGGQGAVQAGGQQIYANMQQPALQGQVQKQMGSITM